MLKKNFSWLGAGLLVFLLSIAQNSSAGFQEGKDYLRLPTPIADKSLPKGKVLVAEFFSYGCPACARFEPVLQQWLAKKPKNVKFERVPVTFDREEWLGYAKIYYVLTNMGIAEQMAPRIFAAIHQQGVNLSQESAIENFLTEQGVNVTEFKSIYSFSPGIQAQINSAEEKTKQYLMNETLIKKFNWLPQIPTMVINGKYLISSGLVDGDNEKLLNILNMLIKKESADK